MVFVPTGHTSSLIMSYPDNWNASNHNLKKGSKALNLKDKNDG